MGTVLLSYRCVRSVTGAIWNTNKAASFYSHYCTEITKITVFFAKHFGVVPAADDKFTLRFYTAGAHHIPNTLISTTDLMLQPVAVKYITGFPGDYDFYYAQFVISQPINIATWYCIALEPSANIQGVFSSRGTGVAVPPYATYTNGYGYGFNNDVSWDWDGLAWTVNFPNFQYYNYFLEANETGAPVASGLLPARVNTGPLALGYDFSQQNNICISSTGRIYYVYRKDDGLGNSQAFLSYSDDGGTTWTEEVVPATAYPGTYSPAIAIDSLDNVHLCIMMDVLAPGFYPGLYYLRRDHVAGWGAPQVIFDDGDRDQVSPSIAIDASDSVHVAWQGLDASYDWQVYHVEITGGIVGVIDQLTSTGGSVSPKIVIDTTGNLYVVFITISFTGVYEIYFIENTAGTWGVITNVTRDDFDRNRNKNGSYLTALIDPTDRLVVVYQNNLTDEFVYFRTYTGIGWTDPQTMPIPLSFAHDGLGAAFTKDGNLHLFLSSGSVGAGYTIYHAIYSSIGTLISNDYITADLPAQNLVNNALWANYPIVGGSRTQIGDTNPDVAFYKFAASEPWMWPLGLPAPPPPPVNTIPIVETLDATNVYRYTAVINGALIDNGGLDCAIGFEYGVTPALGTIVYVSGNFSQRLFDLLPNTQYFFRAFATNSVGTGFGTILSFTTSNVLSPIFSFPNFGIDISALIALIVSERNILAELKEIEKRLMLVKVMNVSQPLIEIRIAIATYIRKEYRGQKPLKEV